MNIERILLDIAIGMLAGLGPSRSPAEQGRGSRCHRDCPAGVPSLTTPFGTHDPKTAAVNAVEAGEGEWQPIATAPEEVDILLWSPSWDLPWIASFREEEGWEDADGSFRLSEPTHWQPLPAPPVTER